MFERFTDRARRIVVLAQEEARALNHNYIGTEHLLLGMIQEGDGIAAKVMEILKISPGAVRDQVRQVIGEGQQPPSGHIPFTPRGKKVLELALREALQLGANYIGTEHILLGLIREGEGVGAQVLAGLGAELNAVRRVALDLVKGRSSAEVAAEVSSGRRSPAHVRNARMADVLTRLADRLGECTVVDFNLSTSEGPDGRVRQTLEVEWSTE